MPTARKCILPIVGSWSEGWAGCRGILVRYEKKANNYMAVLKLACALIGIANYIGSKLP